MFPDWKGLSTRPRAGKLVTPPRPICRQFHRWTVTSICLVFLCAYLLVDDDVRSWVVMTLGP